MAKVSVIVPMYNSGSTIEIALESIRNQSYNDYEVIIVNDGSTDNSIEIVLSYIKRYSLTHWKLIHKENGGVSSARNLGMRNSNGEIIALLDSDDEWHREKLKIQIGYFEKFPFIDFLGCNRNNEEIKILGRKIVDLIKVKPQILLIKMFPQTSTAIFRKSILADVGFYDESMRYCEDGDFWLRVCFKKNFYFIPDNLVITGQGKPNYGYSGLSANLKSMHKGEIKIVENLLERGLINRYLFYLCYLYIKFKYYRRILIVRLR